MTPYVRNLVACEAISRGEPFSLRRVRVKWLTPPSSFGVWAEVANLAEQEFSIQLQVFRGGYMVYETAEELVLAGIDRMEFRYEFATRGIQPKTYKVVVLLNGVPSRNMTLDFGAKDAL